MTYDTTYNRVETSTDGDYTIFTVTGGNYGWGDIVEDVTFQPQLGMYKKIDFVSYTATKGLYYWNTNTWEVGDLNPFQVETLTITTITIPMDTPEAVDFTSTADIIKGALMGEPIIIQEKKDGKTYGVVKGMEGQVGNSVVLRQTNGCDDVTIGASDQTYDNQGNEQNLGDAIHSGVNECFNPGWNGEDTSEGQQPNPGGETTILCPGDPIYNNGNRECIGEPPTQESCIRGIVMGEIFAPLDYTRGIGGGRYFYAPLGEPIWIYPGAPKPLFYVDVFMGRESSRDNRGLKPGCWDGEHATHADFPLMTCNDPEPGKYKCVDGEGNQMCCLWDGDVNLASLYDHVCPEGPPHLAPLWQNFPHEKFQFWYPMGALWIYVKTSIGGYDDTASVLLPDPTWKTLDAQLNYSIVNGPNFVFGTDSNDFKDNYDPAHGGQNSNFISKEQCIQNMQGQGLSDEQIQQACENVGEENQDGWTDCMRRLHSQNPSLTAEELSTMCNEHPGWTSCMINLFYSTGGTMTEDELAEACNGDGNTDAYTLQFNVGLNHGNPFPVYGFMFYVGGTSTCTWGAPGIPLWWTNPGSSIGNFRVCMPTDEELAMYRELGDRYQTTYPDYNSNNIRKDHCIGDDGLPIPNCTPKR